MKDAVEVSEKRPAETKDAGDSDEQEEGSKRQKVRAKEGRGAVGSSCMEADRERCDGYAVGCRRSTDLL